MATSPQVHSITGNSNKTFSNAKSLTLKKNTLTLTKGKSYTLTGTVKRTVAAKRLMNHVAKLRYKSTNDKIVTVKDGKLKAVGKGTCKLYVYTHNGIRKVVTVTVK